MVEWSEGWQGDDREQQSSQGESKCGSRCLQDRSRVADVENNLMVTRR